MRKKRVLLRLLVLSTSIFILYGCYSAGAKMVDARESFALNIVPQPKVVNAAENAKRLEFGLNEIKIVYGIASSKTKIGAEEINKHLLKMGFGNKSIAVVSDKEYKKGNEKALIVIGAPGENTLSKSVWGYVNGKDELKSISDNPQGYIIDYVKRDNEIPLFVIAGTSPQGTLYGCITLMQLFGKNGDKLAVPPVFVKDWPDFKWRYIASLTHFLTQSQRAYEFANAPYPGDEASVKEYIDWCLKYKINVVKIIPEWLKEKMTGVFKSYANERGIYAFTFYPKPSIAACTVQEKEENPEKYGDLKNLYRKKYYLTWSRDDLLETQYREFAKLCKDSNAKFCWFHTADTGLTSLNYAQWKMRDALDKKNYGDDYGLADFHVISLIQKVFKEEAPDTQIVYVTYPYTAMVLDDKFPRNIVPDISGAYAEKEKQFINKYFKTFSEKVPKNIYTCLRETDRKSVERWLNATKHPMLIYFETGGYNIINSRPRYIKTFYFEGYDNIYFYPSIYEAFIHGTEPPAKMLLNAEYSWNVNQEGSGYFKESDFSKDLTEPKVVFERIVPRTCRAYWGADAGKNFDLLFQAGIVPDFIENPTDFQKELNKKSAKVLEISGNNTFSSGTQMFLENPEKEMKRQNEKLGKAIPPIENWLDNYSNKKLDPFSYKYGTMLYLFANYWYYKSAVWVPFLEVEKYIVNGEKEKAGKALKEAAKVLKTADEGIKKAIARIKGKHLCLIPTIQKKAMYENMLEAFSKLESKYKELENKVSNMKSSLLIPEKKLEELKKKKYTALKKGIASWDSCPVYSDFTVLSSTPAQSSFYQSKVQVMYDEKNIYIRINMADMPGRKPLTGRNTKNNTDFWSKGNEENVVEIFISPDGKSFYQFACDAMGRTLQFRTSERKTEKINSEWHAEASLRDGSWTCTTSIPFASIGVQSLPKTGQFWKIGIMRQYVNIDGTTESSLISPEMQPRNPSTYPEFKLE